MPLIHRRFRRALAPLLIGAVAAPALHAQQIETSLGQVEVTPMVEGLNEPWSLAFLPDGRFLITERDGALSLYDAEGGEAVAEIGGLPEVFAEGQGGLLDVLVPADFETSRNLLLSFSRPGGEGAGTAIGMGRLSDDDSTLEDFTVLHAVDPVEGDVHFGARIVEGGDGTIYLTTGDRGEGMRAQDPERGEGTVIALRDGEAVIHSIGHRNPQGATLDAEGNLWVIEHGAQGGDELNLVTQGLNYGWPVISYGVDYDGSPIGEGTEREGMEQPVHYWDPSIAPSGLMFYSGTLFPEWEGHVFTGSLNSDLISRLDPADGYAEERISAPETARVRDIREGPDGAIWYLSVGNGTAYRMAPAG